MRKTIVVLFVTAFVASLPSMASAKKLKHKRHHQRPVAVQPVEENVGPRFVSDAVRQIFVPFEMTFGTRRYQ